MCVHTHRDTGGHTWPDTQHTCTQTYTHRHAYMHIYMQASTQLSGEAGEIFIMFVEYTVLISCIGFSIPIM